MLARLPDALPPDAMEPDAALPVASSRRHRLLVQSYALHRLRATPGCDAFRTPRRRLGNVSGVARCGGLAAGHFLILPASDLCRCADRPLSELGILPGDALGFRVELADGATSSLETPLRRKRITISTTSWEQHVMTETNPAALQGCSSISEERIDLLEAEIQASNAGRRAWREWKATEARNLLELDGIARRVTMLDLDIGGDLHAIYEIRMPVPREINGQFLVGDRAVSACRCQEDWLWTSPAGWEPLGVVCPLDILHPNAFPIWRCDLPWGFARWDPPQGNHAAGLTRYNRKSLRWTKPTPTGWCRRRRAIFTAGIPNTCRGPGESCGPHFPWTNFKGVQPTCPQRLVTRRRRPGHPHAGPPHAGTRVRVVY